MYIRYDWYDLVLLNNSLQKFNLTFKKNWWRAWSINQVTLDEAQIPSCQHSCREVSAKVVDTNHENGMSRGSLGHVEMVAAVSMETNHESPQTLKSVKIAKLAQWNLGLTEWKISELKTQTNEWKISKTTVYKWQWLTSHKYLKHTLLDHKTTRSKIVVLSYIQSIYIVQWRSTIVKGHFFKGPVIWLA